jgi:hypothetical protein
MSRSASACSARADKSLLAVSGGSGSGVEQTHLWWAIPLTPEQFENNRPLLLKALADSWFVARDSSVVHRLSAVVSFPQEKQSYTE